MLPYSGLSFFYIMFLLFIPAIVLGLRGKSIKKYGVFVNIIFLLLIFGNSLIQSLCLLAFYLGELILIFAYIKIRKKTDNKYLLWTVIFLSLLPLFLVKGCNIFVHKQIGFLGVSYLTFKVIQILVEVYDELIEHISLVDFTYFLLFFPTITSGPIDRSRRFIQDSNKTICSSEYKDLLKRGIYKIFKGIGYKFIFGTIISMYWMNKVPADHTFVHTLSYMYAYSFYLFFDFAGYSNMAVGTSYILGIKTMENFNLPFLSRDMKDFWNRWHMSLSFWFRDFIYTRFVMNSIKKKRFKSRYTASYIGYFITMGTMGIWHGVEIYYIIYGLYHAILLIGTDYIERKSKWYKKARNNNFWNIIFTFITFNLVCFSFLIFSGYLFKR